MTSESWKVSGSLSQHHYCASGCRGRRRQSFVNECGRGPQHSLHMYQVRHIRQAGRRTAEGAAAGIISMVCTVWLLIEHISQLVERYSLRRESYRSCSVLELATEPREWLRCAWPCPLITLKECSELGFFFFSSSTHIALHKKTSPICHICGQTIKKKSLYAFMYRHADF